MSTFSTTSATTVLSSEPPTDTTPPETTIAIVPVIGTARAPFTTSTTSSDFSTETSSQTSSMTSSTDTSSSTTTTSSTIAFPSATTIIPMPGSTESISSETQVQTTPLSGPSSQTTSSPNGGDEKPVSKTARNSTTVAVVAALVALIFFGMIGLLFFRWRRRRRAARAATVTERAHRFDDIPLDSQIHLLRAETNEAYPMDKTLFHRTKHLKKGSLRVTPLGAEGAHGMFMQAEQALETPEAERSNSARQAQIQLAEENRALRVRIREMEGLSSTRSTSASESDTPPDYYEAGIAL